MHDLQNFRANLDAIAEKLSQRGFQLDVAQFRVIDQQRRAALAEAEELKAQRNAESQQIAKLKREGADTAEQQAKVREIGDRIGALDQKAKDLDEAFRDLLSGIPNIPHESVPQGRSADDNVEINTKRQKTAISGGVLLR